VIRKREKVDYGTELEKIFNAVKRGKLDKNKFK
jgi:hypothetical protein